MQLTSRLERREALVALAEDFSLLIAENTCRRRLREFQVEELAALEPKASNEADRFLVMEAYRFLSADRSHAVRLVATYRYYLNDIQRRLEDDENDR